MPRRNRNKDRFKPVAEQSAHYSRNVLKIVRFAGDDDSATINGAVMDMVNDGVVPEFKRSVYRHSLFVLDPRLVKADLNRGFKLGFEAYRRKIEVYGRLGDDEVVAKIGNIMLKRAHHDGPRSLLFLSLLSEDLVKERVGYYEVLTDNGVKGLETKIQKPGSLELFLGQLDIPKVHRALRSDEQDLESDRILDAITTSFSVHNVDEVRLGPSHIPGLIERTD